jgi:hypothetical protein
MSVTNVQTRLILEGGDVIAHSRQDVEDIIEGNKALAGEPQKSDWARHVATIPNVILVMWLNEEWMRGNLNLRMFSAEFTAIVKRKLDDPQWRYLRTDK